jgi:dUTPase
MKTLEEKKLLVKMMKAFGQPVDEELVESIRREEEFAKVLFKEQIKEEKEPPKEVVLIKEADPSPPASPAVELPSKQELVQQVINVLDTKKANANTSVYRDKEIEGIRRTVAEMMQKISTMSWGGGGTGIVKIIDADDLDRSSVQNGRYMKYQDGWFVMDEINPYEIIHNTTLVTTNTYTVIDSDYYIGINYAGPVTITIPAGISSGREVVIKDESGNCETHNITVTAKVDNDANGFILAINNGAVHMLYRGDSWRII